MTPSRIITFEGQSLVSQAIGTLTGTRQSHVAWQTPDGTLWEAVAEGFKATSANGQPLAPPWCAFQSRL